MADVRIRDSKPTQTARLDDLTREVAAKEVANSLAQAVASASQAAALKAEADLIAAQKTVAETAAVINTATASLAKAEGAADQANAAAATAQADALTKEGHARACAETAAKLKAEADRVKSNAELVTQAAKASAVAVTAAADLAAAQKTAADAANGAKTAAAHLAMAHETLANVNAAAAAARQAVEIQTANVKATALKAAVDNAAADKAAEVLVTVKERLARRETEPAIDSPRGLGKLWAMVFPPPGPTIRRGDSSREIVETIVFVVVLVLLLKSFVAEAFVIPTGSMAETLYGYQKNVECPECKYVFPVNCSQEIEGQGGMKTPVMCCTCPNCRLDVKWGKNWTPDKDGGNLPNKDGPDWKNGDRVLVAKFIYDTGAKEINPFDVVVFKFPEQPQRDYTPMNYIKRLIGKPGQTIGIHYGDLFVAEGLPYGDDEADRPLRRQTHRSDQKARELLENRGPDKHSPFHILRKAPDKILAMRRIVYDNDHQAKDLIEAGKPPRWDASGSGWKPDDPREPKRFRSDPSGADVGWLGYQHLMRNGRVELITDFIGYNTGGEFSPGTVNGNWVGDLLIECEVSIEKAEGELIFDLAKGVDRFQARFQLSTGTCTLVRRDRDGKDNKLAEQETALKKPGEYRVRFANVDERLTVWVDKSLPFGDGVTYEPFPELAGDGIQRFSHGPTEKDLSPVRIGARGAALTVHGLKLWRDTYYTNWTSDYNGESVHSSVWSDPGRFADLNHLPATTLYVQPKHYLCLGDNSPASSDSRSWGVRDDAGDTRGGLVPEELMLGRALMVYYPFSRFGPIR